MGRVVHGASALIREAYGTGGAARPRVISASSGPGSLQKETSVSARLSSERVGETESAAALGREGGDFGVDGRRMPSVLADGHMSNCKSPAGASRRGRAEIDRPQMVQTESTDHRGGMQRASGAGGARRAPRFAEVSLLHWRAQPVGKTPNLSTRPTSVPGLAPSILCPKRYALEAIRPAASPAW